MSKEIKSLIIPFLLGGTIIAGVKFAATHLDDPALAAIIAAIPTGLISIYFLSSDKSLGYAHNYFYITLILATSIMLFYVLQSNTKMHKNLILLISLGTWGLLAFLRYIYSHRNDK